MRRYGREFDNVGGLARAAGDAACIEARDDADRHEPRQGQRRHPALAAVFVIGTGVFGGVIVTPLRQLPRSATTR